MIRNISETLKVLFVDDDADDVYLISRELSKEFNVSWKRVDTEVGLRASLTEHWDIVLCDYKLPRLSSEDALSVVNEVMRAQPAVDLPFIVISGVVDESVTVNLLLKGARDFVSKDKLHRLSFAIRREMQQANERVRNRLRVDEAFESTIEAWGKALELRDHYTMGHTERVTALALRLAVKLDLSHLQFVNVQRGSLLHDIGKMGIPDAILLKRDSLTIEEMEIMKQHPLLAWEMIKDIPFLKDALDIPYCHHERWNGSGYPRRLSGGQIPYIARLFSICDVYEALTSDRPYRESWEKARAIDYIIGERGYSFDPHMTDSFVDMIGRG